MESPSLRQCHRPCRTAASCGSLGGVTGGKCMAGLKALSEINRLQIMRVLLKDRRLGAGANRQPTLSAIKTDESPFHHSRGWPAAWHCSRPSCNGYARPNRLSVYLLSRRWRSIAFAVERGRTALDRSGRRRSQANRWRQVDARSADSAAVGRVVPYGVDPWVKRQGHRLCEHFQPSEFSRASVNYTLGITMMVGG